MKILLISEYSPFESSFGAQQRSHHLWRALQSIGTVDVMQLRHGESAHATRGQDRRFVVSATYAVLPLGFKRYQPDPRLSEAIGALVDLGQYDLICARYLGPVSKLALPAGVPVIVDLDDVGYAYGASGSPLRNLLARLKSGTRALMERHALRRFPRFFFVSERDRARYTHLQGAVLPNIPMPPAKPPDPHSAGRTIIFVGALWYGPNRDGVNRFLARCWPTIRAAHPDARLLLVGAAPDTMRASWARHEGVSAPGFVPDLDAAYSEAAFSVVPIHSGGGTNIKVLESLAHARACVTTRFCFGGFTPHFVEGVELLVADDDEQIAQYCIALLGDPDLRRRSAEHGLMAVRRHYSYDAFRRVVADQVDHATSPR